VGIENSRVPGPSESSSRGADETQPRIQSMHSGVFKVMFGSLIAMLVVSFLLTQEFANAAFELAYFLGAFVGAASGFIGFLMIERFIDRSNLAFLKGVFMGMAVRMLLLLGILVLFVKVLRVHVIGMVTGLLIFYFAMTIFEVVFLSKGIETKGSVRP